MAVWARTPAERLLTMDQWKGFVHAMNHNNLYLIKNLQISDDEALLNERYKLKNVMLAIVFFTLQFS